MESFKSQQTTGPNGRGRKLEIEVIMMMMMMMMMVLIRVAQIVASWHPGCEKMER